MEKSQVAATLSQYTDKIPSNKTMLLKNKLEQADENTVSNLAMVKLHNPIVVLLISIFLGALGIDRFMIGDVGLGICKLLFGWITFGIWPLIDIFCSYKKAKEKNLQSLLNVL